LLWSRSFMRPGSFDKDVLPQDFVDSCLGVQLFGTSCVCVSMLLYTSLVVML